MSCSCCAGTTTITPQETANRPGLPALRYRVGTHAAFLESMLARLSTFFLDITKDELDGNGQPVVERIYPLRGLTTRAADDPAIALLDAWAILGDLLAFYQERIANEGYLRTATERRSILELARLVGYALRPGVAATVYLAYTIDSNQQEEVVIPAGARSQSVPGPGELPQSFETSEPLKARAAWNLLRPRLAKPQTADSLYSDEVPHLYLKGVTTNLKPNDPLIITLFGDPQFVRVQTVTPDAAADRTLVVLQEWRSWRFRAAGGTAAVVAETKEQLAATIRRYLGEETDRIDLSRDSKTYRGVSGQLERLEELLGPEVPFASVMGHLAHETLPQLEAARQIAEENQYTKLRPWIEGLLTDLAVIGAEGARSHSEALAREGVRGPREGTRLAAQGGKPFTGMVGGLVKAPSLPPANALQLRRTASTTFQPTADTGLQVLGRFDDKLRRALPLAVANAKVTKDPGIKVYALRVKASLFGSTAQGRPEYRRDRESGMIVIDRYVEPTINDTFAGLINGNDPLEVVALDAAYDEIKPTSWAVIERPVLDDEGRVRSRTHTKHRVTAVQTTALPAGGVATKSTQLSLERPWLAELDAAEIERAIFTPATLRGTVVYTQSEELALADEPITDPICGSDEEAGAGGLIELDGLYSDLEAGRWLIVSGERTDIQVPDPDRKGATIPVPGIFSQELVMLSEVVQRIAADEDGRPDDDSEREPVRGEQTHTFIHLASTLEYCYKRGTVKIYGNVAQATHGETRRESLGSGDGSKALQTFTLKQQPLTFVAAPNPQGVESTLQVYVNDIEWHEATSLAGLGRSDRAFTTRTGDDDKTTMIFGNGERGARLPTGIENVRAVYRNGIGKVGNVKAEQISLLVSRPLGVKEVINPLRASGGADRESRDGARSNAPLAVLALDRLVSTQDYADFARVFAGIGKASAARLSDGRRQVVYVTIAGAEDIPIDKTSDLYRNLVAALRRFGDPHQQVVVELRELLLMVVSANVRLLPDYPWENVAPTIRAKLLDTFSFERRELGQDVALSEVIATVQGVPGVAYVDIDLLRGIPEKVADGANPGQRRLLTPEEIAAAVSQPLYDAQGREVREPLPRLVVEQIGFENGAIRPAQLAFLAPELSATLILNEI